MNRIKMSEGLLHLIVMVQDYKNYLMSRVMFERYFHNNVNGIDFYKETKDFYYNIDSEILKQYGLSKNDVSFNKVYNYKVTEEMENIEYCFLDKFEF